MLMRHIPLEKAVRLILSIVCLAVFSISASSAVAAAKRRVPGAATQTVYDKQPPTTEKELSAFLELLPRFRAWARSAGVTAHPHAVNGRADFLYPAEAASWVSRNGWKPVRFFCVMGRMAAALAIIEEGNDLKNVHPADMPTVSEAELELARRHLGELLKAGGEMPPPESR